MTVMSGAVLAGGRSSRFGRDKAELIYKGRSFLAHTKELLSAAGLDPIYLSHPDHIADLYPGHGPISGIYSVLMSANDPERHVVFLPVDMPNITIEVIQGLIQAPLDQNLVTYEGHHMPLRLTHTPHVQKRLEAILQDASNLSLGHFFDQIDLHYILPTDHLKSGVFSNINTPSEYQILSS